MTRCSRKDVFNPRVIQYLHCTQKCVRHSFLMGEDKARGLDCGHRLQWIDERIRHLCKYFAIDALSMAVLSNHLHLILRNRPDLVDQWDNLEVARRWLNIFPGKNPAKRKKETPPYLPSSEAIEALAKDKKKIELIRIRLSDISWFMSALAQYIAVRANFEDNVTGRFWEGRFKAQNLLDETALLACAIYVDLNPIRACIANTPEESEFTSAMARIRAFHDRVQAGDLEMSKEAKLPDSFLAPIEMNQLSDDPKPSRSGFRASNLGFLNMTASAYLELLDWSGREIRSDKRGAIPSHLEPILERLGIGSSSWIDLVRNYKTNFRQVVGRTDSVEKERERLGKRWLQVPALKHGLID